MDVELNKQENKRLREKMNYFFGYTHTLYRKEEVGLLIVVVFLNARKREWNREVFEMWERLRWDLRERKERDWEIEMRFEREEARGSCIKNIRRVTFVVHIKKLFFIWNLNVLLNILEIYTSSCEK